jgi:hypothetical protein
LEKSEPDAASAGDLTSIIAAQLQVAIAALDNKQSEAAVGQFLAIQSQLFSYDEQPNAPLSRYGRLY